MPAKVVLDEIDSQSPGGTVKTVPDIILDASTLNNYIVLPSGTSLQRIDTPGMLRWNTDIGAVEYYSAGKWLSLALEGEYENITRAGMVLYLDSADTDSYSRTGTSITNLTKWSIISANMVGGITYDLVENAFNFDSVNDYILLGDQFCSDAMVYQDGATYSFWFKADSSLNFGTGNGQKLLFGAGDAGALRIRIGVAPNGGIFYADNGANNVINTGTNYNDDTWHNLTITRPKGATTTIQAYIDGVNIGSLGNTNPRYDVATIACIGASIEGTTASPTVSDFFGGKISSVIIHDRSLNASEVLNNYNAFAGRYN